MAEAVSGGVVDGDEGAGCGDEGGVARGCCGGFGQGFGAGLERRQVEPAGQLGLDGGEFLGQGGGMGGEVQRHDRVGEQAPDGADVDAGVADEVGLVDLVEEVVGGVPPPAEGVAHLDRGGGLVAEGAEEAGDADAPEGHVGGAAFAAAFVLEVGFGADGFGGEAGEFGVAGAFGHDGGADAAGAVDVDVDGAAAFELVPVGVGVPAGAGVAAVAVAGPEAEAEVAAPLAAVGGHDAGDLHHGGVGAAVVHDAVVPGVVVAAEEDEGAVGVGSIQVGLEDGGLAPAGVDFGVEGDVWGFAAGQAVAEGGAVGVGDGAGDGCGEVGEGFGAGAAPDRGDAHFVEVFVRADVELPGGPGLEGASGDGGVGDAFDEDDGAGETIAGEVGVGAVGQIDQGGGEACGGRRAGEGVGYGGEWCAVGLDGGLAGQADVGVVADEGGAVAGGVELGLDVAHAFELVGGA